MGNGVPVLMIGLDAAELTLVERLCDEGQLPTLAGLRQHGCFGSLEAEATIFSGAVWPTFYTAKRVPWHGIYHDRLWRYDKMRFEMAHDEWLSATLLGSARSRLSRGHRGRTAGPADTASDERRHGQWMGTHDRVFTGIRPRRLGVQLRRECGPPVMSSPFVRPRTAAEFLALRDDMVATTQQMARLCRRLLARGPWDLFCVVFGAPHRGGHHLWDLSQIEPSGMHSPRAELECALEDVYVACDRPLRRCSTAARRRPESWSSQCMAWGPTRGGTIASRRSWRPSTG
jgi:hypothetical protein